MTLHIRPATADDANAISTVIIRSLRQTNAADYSAALIAQIEDNFTPVRVLALLEQRQVLVALVDQQVVATASLQGNVVRSVFVAPEMQGRGLGRALMQAVEALAQQSGQVLLRIPSSITAQGFYARLGYVQVREVMEGAERIIVMERALRS
ncbi:GNAT family N-acetyltransferase [Pseudomonas sp. TNT2022 ID1025]|uniref:GNAT family N-acetyltransferase n=2 Tax=Pseudomonas rubra TaxID=2942627 RepID=A0ABT5P9F8_9PSED|nr:GNAT family N-acetyltransferase [Pseudomonas rubra]MDD1014937.1 GNAT family N-acetyltransferase [Pseudomonas rubra]MDD1041316.1 GNAT family N-acetyltransferase [Pseudomonas rubra]MDD1157807.1 GNAT family N-acetyltransferase [Pseudomonas rubra]